MKKTLNYITGLVLMITSKTDVLAASVEENLGLKNGYSAGPKVTEESFREIIGNSISIAGDFLLQMLPVIALLMIVYAGILWVISRGESGDIDKGKDIIIYVIVGIIVAFLAVRLISAVTTLL